MNYRETIREMWTDKDGNYVLGLENNITPDKLIDTLGLDCNDEKIYNVARIELNAICCQICNDGYVAGGIGRNPTHYFIAKNPSERKLIAQKYASNNIGRLKMQMIRGDGYINQRMIKASINTLLALVEDDEEQLELEI